MRILQLIDSLEAGGAERMAVNYANALTEKIGFSALATTRQEGVLKEQLSEEVAYLFASKKSNLDLVAFIRLRTFCKKNKITHVHAHGSSFFWAVLLKWTTTKLLVIWHDHFGNRVNADSRLNKILITSSRFFDLVLTVNKELQNWAIKNLKANKIIYLPNFVIPVAKEDKITVLKGEQHKRIVIVANLKEPKNHLFFLEVFRQSNIESSGWSLHLVGKDFQNSYSRELRTFTKANSMNNVYFYDQCTDVDFILTQCTIGVLASTYEGFPLTLIEYAKAGLILFSTNVGECAAIVQKEEFLFDPKNVSSCVAKLVALILEYTINEEVLFKKIREMNGSINENYSQKAVLDHYLTALNYSND